MGTPQFAVPALEKIHNSKHQIVMVVTAPDKPRGRGRKIGPTPIKEAAIRFGLPVLQPENLKTSTFLEQLMALNPDLNVVVAFRILPESAFSLPRHGSVNLHASLLPKYRGAAPINWAIINGETKTGLTTFLLKKQVDTGDILMQREIDIAEDDDFGSLHDKMAILGANLLMETIEGFRSGRQSGRHQKTSFRRRYVLFRCRQRSLGFDKSCDCRDLGVDQGGRRMPVISRPLY